MWHLALPEIVFGNDQNRNDELEDPAVAEKYNWNPCVSSYLRAP